MKGGIGKAGCRISYFTFALCSNSFGFKIYIYESRIPFQKGNILIIALPP